MGSCLSYTNKFYDIYKQIELDNFKSNCCCITCKNNINNPGYNKDKYCEKKTLNNL